MANKRRLTLSIGDSNEWFSVDLDNCDGTEGYYLGHVELSFTEGHRAYFHVEAIEVNVVNGISPLKSSVTAVNPDYQGRIDRFVEANEGELPQYVTKGRKKYFVHISPFAL